MEKADWNGRRTAGENGNGEGGEKCNRMEWNGRRERKKEKGAEERKAAASGARTL